VYGDGGTKRYALLVAFPEGVVTEMYPVVAFVGTMVARLV
jgi:hypothetical protein